MRRIKQLNGPTVDELVDKIMHLMIHSLDTDKSKVEEMVRKTITGRPHKSKPNHNGNLKSHLIGVIYGCKLGSKEWSIAIWELHNYIKEEPCR